jgi:hypothetical protein
MSSLATIALIFLAIAALFALAYAAGSLVGMAVEWVKSLAEPDPVDEDRFDDDGGNTNFHTTHHED